MENKTTTVIQKYSTQCVKINLKYYLNVKSLN